MTRFIFVRHGKTLLNIDGCFQGKIDLDLSRMGKAEAATAAEVLKDAKFDLVFSSPYKRAMQTAEIVTEGHNVEILPADEMKEMDYGDFDGQKASYLQDREHAAFVEWKKDQWNSKAHKGENYNEVADRAVPFVRSLALKYPDKTILLVGHGTWGRIMIATLLEDEEHIDNYLVNCSISSFNYDGDTVSIASYGENEHLKSLFDGYEVK